MEFVQRLLHQTGQTFLEWTSRSRETGLPEIRITPG